MKLYYVQHLPGASLPDRKKCYYSSTGGFGGIGTISGTPGLPRQCLVHVLTYVCELSALNASNHSLKSEKFEFTRIYKVG